jgi:hypothetical protein
MVFPFIEDLGPIDFMVVECHSCNNVGLLSGRFLLSLGFARLTVSALPSRHANTVTALPSRNDADTVRFSISLRRRA